MDEIVMLSRVLKDVTACDKLNIAAIGNIVPQLHVHLVARRRSDPAWPRPVWGAVPRAPYAEDRACRLHRPHPAGGCLRLRRRCCAGAYCCASVALPPEDSCHPAPISAPSRVSATRRACSTARPSAAPMPPHLRPWQSDPRAGVYVIGGEMVVLKKRATVHEPLFTPDEARALVAHGRSGVPRPARRGRPVRARAQRRNGRDAEDPRRFRRDRFAFDRHPGTGREPSICRRSRRARRCCIGMRVIASVRIAGPPRNLVDGGWRRDCPACKVQHFPRTDPVVIMLPIAGEPLPARPLAPLSGPHVVVPRGLHGAGRGDRGCGATRDPRGGRHRLRPRVLFHHAALAVPDLADDRLPCRGAVGRHRHRPHGARRRALVHPRGGRARCCCASTRTG